MSRRASTKSGTTCSATLTDSTLQQCTTAVAASARKNQPLACHAVRPAVMKLATAYVPVDFRSFSAGTDPSIDRSTHPPATTPYYHRYYVLRIVPPKSTAVPRLPGLPCNFTDPRTLTPDTITDPWIFFVGVESRELSRLAGRRKHTLSWVGDGEKMAVHKYRIVGRSPENSPTTRSHPRRW